MTDELKKALDTIMQPGFGERKALAMTHCARPECQATAGCKCPKVVTVPRPDLGPGYFEVRVDNGSPTIVLTSPREFAFRLGEQGNKTDG